MSDIKLNPDSEIKLSASEASKEMLDILNYHISTTGVCNADFLRRQLNDFTDTLKGNELLKELDKVGSE